MYKDFWFNQESIGKISQKAKNDTFGNQRNLIQVFSLNHLWKWSNYNNKKQNGQKLYITFILHEMEATGNKYNEMRGLPINAKDVKTAYAQR